MPHSSTLIALLLISCSIVRAEPDQWSLARSLEVLRAENLNIQIADRELAAVESDRRRVEALWYPTLDLTGMYVHMANDVAAKQSLAPLAEGIGDLLSPIVGDLPALESLLKTMAGQTLSFPLIDRNLTSVGVNVSWPVFVGGKRRYGVRMARAAVDIAREERRGVDAAEQVRLVESYFALQLSMQVEQVRRATFRAMQMHYRDALSLERNGMIDKAARLAVEVALSEAQTALNASQSDRQVARSVFCSLLKIDSSNMQLTTPLFLNDTLPDPHWFKALAEQRNVQLEQLALGERMADDGVRVGRAGYMPDVALFGQQSLYTHGVGKNLAPRRMVGVGLSWTLFDGLYRESTLHTAQLNRQRIILERQNAADAIRIDIDRLYAQLNNVLSRVKTLNRSLQLSRELLRMRRHAFGEGMATATEVVDAEVMYAQIEVTILSAYYQYDLALVSLYALCGEPDRFFSGAEAITERNTAVSQLENP